MNKIAFYGAINSGDYKVVAAIFKNWLKTEDLDIKIRLSGEEIVYENEQIYLYSYNSVTTEGVTPSFLLEGNMSKTLDEVKVLLQELWQLCQEQNISSSFEYVEVTEDGDEVTEQFYIE
ncbi:MAG: hypothetical protein KME21_01740 [Desmonostoc vinosum HA7617-LM4]|jgi:hypothetical protein|nr:hypothetical protein [Desmonostoc vinosum HA7617-LM4]